MIGAAVERHRSTIEGAVTADNFEQSMSDLLAEVVMTGTISTLPKK
jgi:hypothetical protein